MIVIAVFRHCESISGTDFAQIQLGECKQKVHWGASVVPSCDELHSENDSLLAASATYFPFN